MSAAFELYREHLIQIPDTARAVAEHILPEAARGMTPAGIRNWLEGARVLSELGRGQDMVKSCHGR